MDNFTPLRNGILDHLRDGKISLFEFAIYVCMIMRADWKTGVYTGCAGTLAYQCGEPKSKSKINKVFIQLRRKEYINYRKGDGTRGGYPILINKYDVRIGELIGTRLDAWKHGELAKPEYTPQNGVVPAVKTPSKKQSTPAPANFTPNENNIALAKKLGLDLAAIVPKFLEHYASKGTMFTDWHLALNTWLRREREFSKSNGHVQPKTIYPDLQEESRKAGII
jgi:hypothetical protein